jgi:hypothetical protein
MFQTATAGCIQPHVTTNTLNNQQAFDTLNQHVIAAIL